MAVLPQSPLVQRSLDTFLQFNTHQLQDWTKHVWDNDFDNIDPPPPELDVSDQDTNWIALLDDACNICKEWAKLRKAENEENDENESTANGFWLSLVENEISIKSVIAICFWFMKNGQNRSSSFIFKEACCYSSALYFGLLLIPGSSAFSVFHPVVFQTGVDIFKLINLFSIFNDSGKSNSSLGKRGRSKNDDKKSKNNMKKKRQKKSDKELENEFDEDDEGINDIDSEIDSNDEYQTELTPQNISCLTERIYFVVTYLVKVLQFFSLRRCDQSLHHTILSLSELTRMNENNTKVDRLHHSSSFSSLAYKGLIYICNPLHGEVTKIHLQIMKNLMPNILIIQNSSTNSRNQNIIKENVIQFIIDLLKTYGDVMNNGIITFVQHVCVNALDKADNRTKIANFITSLLTKLPLPLYVECMKWVKKFVLHSKVNNRMLGMEILSSMLSEKERKVDENSQRDLVPYVSHKCLLSFIVSRCCDKASSVRAKALSILAGRATSTVSRDADIIKELMSDSRKSKRSVFDRIVTNKINKDGLATESNENARHMHEIDMDVHVTNSGKEIVIETEKQSSDKNHACEEEDHVQEEESSTKDNKHKIIELICRRCNDEKVHTRKAALQVLENMLKLVPQLMVDKNISILTQHCLDPALLARKQSIQSLCVLLERFPDNSLLQCKWVEGVLPEIFDGESTCQEKCLEAVESIIFGNIVPYSRSNSPHHQMAWKILALISKQEYHDYQQYIRKACCLWARAGKLKNSIILILQSHIGTENNDPAWLLLSQFLSYIELKDYSFVLDYWMNSDINNENPATLQRVLQIIGYTSRGTPKDKILLIIDNLKDRLKQISSTSFFIPMMLQCLKKLIILTTAEDTEAEMEMKNFCTELTELCDTVLSDAVLKQNTNCKMTEDEIIHYIHLLGEIALRCPASITKRIHLLIPSLVAAPLIADSGHPIASSQLKKPFKNCATMSPRIRAHAVLTLGKLCLQDEKLAKSYVPALARELDTSNEAVIRNNIIIVLCDLCKRYTGLIDVFVTRIAACLKDPSMTISQQTLILLTQLLQEDYIKWKGSLFYHYVTLLVDENPNIRQMTEYCLVHTLLQRNPTKLYHHFLECVFHFNCYERHPTYNKFPQSEREIQLFSLKGSGKNQEKRLTLYKFLLENMADEHRFQLTAKLVQDILGAFVDGIIQLDSESQCLLQDALAILVCDEIKLATLRSVSQEDMEEADITAVVVATAKKTIISQVVKKNVIENIVPVVISLKHMLEKLKSPLLRELMMFLKDLMKDYKNEIKDILAADNQLANEIEFDLNRFSQEQEEEERQKQERLKNHPTNGERKTSKRDISVAGIRPSLASSALLSLSKTTQDKAREETFINHDKTLVANNEDPASQGANDPATQGTNEPNPILSSEPSLHVQNQLKQNTLPTTKAEPISPPPETKLLTRTNVCVTPTLCRSFPNLELGNKTPLRAVSTPVGRVGNVSFRGSSHSLQMSPILNKPDNTDDQENEKLIIYLPPPK